ncbi:MAG TPA: hypothetical protein VGB41_00475 [Acidimicrobiia bacterium]|jgi:hypothetical protein
MTADVEATLARHLVRRAVVVGPLVVAGAWALRGVDGAVAAAVGVTVVVANFLVSGLVLSAAARISLTLYHAAALVGFLLRLVLITVVMLVVARLFDIDRIAFGVAAVVSYLVLLTLEAAAVARGRERELEWTS